MSTHSATAQPQNPDMTHVIHKLSFGDKLQVSPETSLALGECSESGLMLDTLLLWMSLQCKLKAGGVHSCHQLGREQCPVTEQLCCVLLKLRVLLENSVERVRNESLWLIRILVLA